MWSLKLRRFGSTLAFFALISTFLTAPPAAGALIRVRAATDWGHTLAGTNTIEKSEARPRNAPLPALSTFDVRYSNFPEWAKVEIQSAIDIWAANFKSSVPIVVNASWGRSSSWGILGSARPVSFYSGFPNSPDPSLWYPSALANALAGKDLDRSKSDILIQVNEEANWNTRGDGSPTSSEYDLHSVFLHEIAHGLGFISSDSYDTYFGVGSIDQPTPVDAFAQTSDGRRLADLPSPSLELGKAFTTSLVWAGPLATAANGGVKPKLYTPSNYEVGSSVFHLDEATFAKSFLDSVMTPNLNPGEVFTGPGPILLAMMADMRNKPPAGPAIGLPKSPRNVQALTGDTSVLITFDPPVNLRTAQITGYVVTNLKSGIEKMSPTSPVLVTGLKNGVSYTFSIVAKNALGTSAPIESKAITPQATWESIVLDRGADGRSVASTVFNGLPAVAYTDSRSGDLKLTLWTGSRWRKYIVDGDGRGLGKTNNPVTGDISLCVNGSWKKQTLHIIYNDSKEKDLRYAAFNGKSFTHEIIDGNGVSVNSYKDPIRVRTSSDVSVANACVATAAGVQVFYRDESQGILLGAVKSRKNKWVYELIDGDSTKNSRTTGDVGFHIQAIYRGSITYLAYDSVMGINQREEMTSGAVRIATRNSISPKSWKYQTLDLSTDDATAFGFDIALAKTPTDIMVTWLAASISSLPKADQIHWAKITSLTSISKITTENFGTPAAEISTDGQYIAFNCADRLCVLDTSKKSSGQGAIRLARSAQASEVTQSTWVTVNKSKYLVTSVNNQLSLLRP